MKTLVTLLGLFLAATFVSASHLNSNLIIRSNDNYLISAEINGIIYPPSEELKIQGINRGNHHVKVYKHYNSFCGNYRYKESIYRGRVSIPAKSRVVASVGEWSGFRINRVTPLQNINRGCSPHKPHRRGYTIGRTLQTENHHYGVNHFASIKGAIRNESFDNSKLIVAKQSLRGRNLTSNQVALLMKEFSFEKNRLSFAKYAHKHVIDPENYYVVNNSFSFSSSTRSLDRYLNVN